MSAPKRLGRYEILQPIGQGAMGEVFRAHDPVLNRDVAIKRISAGLDTDEMVRKRFQRRHRLPVEEYLKPQKRFAHLFGKNEAVDTIARIQAMAERNIRKYRLIDERRHG